MASHYYVKCPDCGALLDRGERCDCEQLTAQNRERVAGSARRKNMARWVEAAEAGHACEGYDQSKKYYREWDYA